MFSYVCSSLPVALFMASLQQTSASKWQMGAVILCLEICVSDAVNKARMSGERIKFCHEPHFSSRH